MKQFVIGGLDTPEMKKEAESILQKLGYKSDEEWNRDYRNHKMCDFIKCKSGIIYEYHSHTCKETPITLDDLRAMVPEPNQLNPNQP